MRRALVALTVALPACLSGFSEIRIARPDAGTVDSARADTPAPADAPQSLSDALDALVVPDAQVTPMDAPEVAVPVDVVAGPDVHDVGAVGVDVQDVPDELPHDASSLADRVDVVGAMDVATVFDVQCPTALCNGVCVNSETDPAHCGRCGNSCSSGEECVSGRCGRWVFRTAIPVSGDFGSESGLRRYTADRCGSVAAVPCPSSRRLIEAGVDLVRSADGGMTCGALLTSEVVAVRVNLYVSGCWSCAMPPSPIAGGCALSPPNLLACCAFE